MKLIINYMVFFMIYVIPLLIFIKYSLRNKINKGIIIFTSTIYLIFCIFTSEITYNLFPFVIVICDLILMNKDKDRHNIDEFKFNFKDFNIMAAFKYAVLNYILTMVVSIIFMMILTSFKVVIKDQKIVKEMIDFSVSKFIIMMPMTMIFAPVIEEFVFRWFLYEKVLKRYVGIYIGAILSSIIFAAFHANLKSFAVIMSIGILNCWLIDKKGYWYAVFNHFFFNSINVLMMLCYKL